MELFDTSAFCVNDETPVASGISMSCHAGDLAEMHFMIQAKMRMFGVYTPHGHAVKADLVVIKPPYRPISVQVKKATFTENTHWRFMPCSGKPSSARNPKDYGKRYTPYKVGDFDVLAARIEEHDCFCFYHYDDIAGRTYVRWYPHGESPSDNWDIFEDERFML